ncbi:MAG TPA: hypothetical protein VHO69_18085 [Phototrophicaceae bacterium]|nr:hypothetical protein [Phototrophicaceae bacterium]
MNPFKQIFSSQDHPTPNLTPRRQSASPSPTDPDMLVKAILNSHVATANFDTLDHRVAQLFAFAAVCVEDNPAALETFLAVADELAASPELEQRIKAFLIFATFKNHDARAYHGLNTLELPITAL